MAHEREWLLTSSSSTFLDRLFPIAFYINLFKRSACVSFFSLFVCSLLVFSIFKSFTERMKEKKKRKEERKERRKKKGREAREGSGRERKKTGKFFHCPTQGGPELTVFGLRSLDRNCRIIGV